MMNEEQARENVLKLRDRIQQLDNDQLDLIFREARTFNAWQDKKIEERLLRQLYNLMIMGPTSANSLPIRIVFVISAAGKERLKPLMSEMNREKTMAAPATAILGYDTQFYNNMDRTFPLNPAFAEVFKKNAALAESTAFRNSTLQGAYFIIAARALGLDCGPMSGFDNAGIDREFFGNGSVKSNFVCSIGYGDITGVFPRLPRLDFDELCQIV